jgi:type II secretory pathway component PulJ
MNFWNKENKYDKQKGLTLIEVIVATSIFVLMIIATMAIYFNILKSQQNTRALMLVQQEAKYVLAVISKDIRMSEIMSAGGINSILDIKAFKIIDDPDYGYEETSNKYYLENNKLIKKIGTKEYQLTSDRLKVDNLYFYVYKTSTQARVTIVMTVSNNQGSLPEAQKKISLQTTVSSRIYEK